DAATPAGIFGGRRPDVLPGDVRVAGQPVVRNRVHGTEGVVRRSYFAAAKSAGSDSTKPGTTSEVSSAVPGIRLFSAVVITTTEVETGSTIQHSFVPAARYWRHFASSSARVWLRERISMARVGTESLLWSTPLAQ